MKKRIFAVLLTMLVLSALMLSGWNGWKLGEATRQIGRLEKELQLAQSRIQMLETRMEELEQGTATPFRNCSLIVGQWEWRNGMLLLDSAYIQVMAEDAILESASLELLVNEEVFAAQLLELNPGEAQDSYELEMVQVKLDLPELVEGDHVTLQLKAYLTDGTQLSTAGADWDYESGNLLMIAG